MEVMLDGLIPSVKENIGKCISTKELWVKLEKLYLVEEIVEASPTILKIEEEASINKNNLNIFEKEKKNIFYTMDYSDDG